MNGIRQARMQFMMVLGTLMLAMVLGAGLVLAAGGAA